MEDFEANEVRVWTKVHPPKEEFQKAQKSGSFFFLSF